MCYREAASSILILIALLFVDIMCMTSQGILRGMGRQLISVLLNSLALYSVGLPMAYYFGFHIELGVIGLWLGMICSAVVALLLLGFVIYRTNWQKMSVEARARVS